MVDPGSWWHDAMEPRFSGLLWQVPILVTGGVPSQTLEQTEFSVILGIMMLTWRQCNAKGLSYYGDMTLSQVIWLFETKLVVIV